MEIGSVFNVVNVIFLLQIGAYSATESNIKQPTVVISILIRNKAHILPYFFQLLTELDYPKDRVSIWIASDHNQDNSIDIINAWVMSEKDSYHSVHTFFDDYGVVKYKDEDGPWHWSNDHMDNVIKIRNMALKQARRAWADYIWMLDADVLLTDPLALRKLIEKKLDIIAPMLVSYSSHSNYWCGMEDNYYYKRTEEYQEILRHNKKGCFEVPMVHSAVLISLKLLLSDRLTYDSSELDHYLGPRDDIITFVISANNIGLKLHICNDDAYGFVTVPSDNSDEFDFDKERSVNLLQKLIAFDVLVIPHPTLAKFVTYPKPEKLSFSEIYVLNLKRRSERKIKMEQIIKLLGLDVAFMDAVDGRSDTTTWISANYFPP